MPFPVAFAQPMDEPCENLDATCVDQSGSIGCAAPVCTHQKQPWPDEQGSVPLLHAQVYGSMSPVFGCLPSAHGMPGSASTALRLGGMIIEPCAWATVGRASMSAVRSMLDSQERVVGRAVLV